MQGEPAVQLRLSLQDAEALHALLERLLESGEQDPHLENAYRLLGWRILAAKGGKGLTGRMADLAREADSLQEYEATRERELGPVLDGLQRAENRDP